MRYQRRNVILNNEGGVKLSLPKTLFFKCQRFEKPNFPEITEISILSSWTYFENSFTTVTSLPLIQSFYFVYR